MNRITLRARIFISYAAVIALALVSINIFALRQLNDAAEGAFYEGFDEKFDIAVITVEDALERQEELGLDDNNALLVANVQRVAQNFDIRVQLIDLAGETLLYDSESDVLANGWDGSDDVDHLVETLDPIDVIDEDEDHLYRAEFLFVAEDEPELVVRLGESLEPLHQAQRAQSLTLVLGSAAGGVLLLAVFGGWVTGTLVRPLTSLRATAAAMAAGKLSTRAATQAPPEIATLAEEFNRMADAVEAMVAEQKAFAGNAAHELRTPLTAIRVRTELILEDEPDPALTRRYVGEIDAETRRMSKLVDDLRLLSRIDAEQLTAGEAEVDVGRLLHAINYEFEHTLAQKRLAYTVSLPESPILVRGNITHLRIALRNLIENAVKFTPPDGTIAVTVRRVDGLAEITIVDSGIGIAAVDHPFLFNRFYRVDPARARATPGSGLGLSLVQAMVRLYGGTVAVTSPGLGAGTTATIRLPAV